MKKSINDINFMGKKVLIRVDFNVPIQDQVIQSDQRIAAAIPTIKYIVAKGAKVILMSHLGRVKTEQDKIGKSLKIVASKLQELIKMPVQFIKSTRGPEVESAISNLANGQILMLENTRFEDTNNGAESKNSEELGKYWASLFDVYVNDAFGTSHRAHASNVGVSTYIKESAIGLLVEKELKMLSQGLETPQKPFVAIIGGAKVSDKIGVIENLLNKADKILIGGGMAYTFLSALGYKIGSSLIENEYVEVAKSFLDKGGQKLLLPIDHAIADSFSNNERQETSGVDIKNGFMGLDIGEKTIALYKEALNGAKTVVWNGPMGVAEFSNFSKGTDEIANTIANLDGVFSVIGGGDSAAAAIKLGYEDKFTHISTGGGAALVFMEGKILPGIEVIQNKE